MRHYQPGDDKGNRSGEQRPHLLTFRTLQTLVMQDYNAFAPDVQHARKHLNSKQLSSSIHTELFEIICVVHPKEAQRLLQKF